MNNKLQILNKTFENKKVRTVWNPDEEKYYISVIDIVGVLTDSEYYFSANGSKNINSTITSIRASLIRVYHYMMVHHLIA